MRIASLTTMTAVALLALSPAYAAGQDRATADDTSMQTGMSNDTEMEWSTGTEQNQSWSTEQTGDQAANTADVETIQVAILDDSGAQPETKTILKTNTAEGIIGKEVTNQNGDTIASVEDIIIDSGGNAQNVVLAHGGFLGLGQDRVALEYDQVVTRGEEGDALSNITEAELNQARPFSYEQAEGGDTNTMTMASTNISVDKVLGSEIRDPQGEKVATAENIHFKDGKAEHVLISPEAQSETADMLAIAFADMQLVRENDSYHFELSSAQMDNLNQYREQTGAATEADPYSDMESTPEDRMMMEDTTAPQTEEY